MKDGTHIVRLSRPCPDHPTGLYWSAMRADGVRGVVANRDDATRYEEDHAELILEEAVKLELTGMEPGIETAGDDE